MGNDPRVRGSHSLPDRSRLAKPHGTLQPKVRMTSRPSGSTSDLTANPRRLLRDSGEGTTVGIVILIGFASSCLGSWILLVWVCALVCSMTASENLLKPSLRKAPTK